MGYLWDKMKAFDKWASEPCFQLTIMADDDEPRHIKQVFDEEKLMLQQQNKELKRRLMKKESIPIEFKEE